MENLKNLSADKLTLLVKAILSRVKERRGYTTKTKLFKYLYLTDLEHYRYTGETLTGIDWIFYHYGPWAQECETLYAKLKDQGEIRVNYSQSAEFETEFVNPAETVALEQAIENIRVELAVREQVDRWADEKLGDMLNYVYLHTEPMENAVRRERLDFSKIERGGNPQPATLPRANDNPSAIARMRKTIAEKTRVSQSPPPSMHFTPPRYDEVYDEAMRIMEEKDDGY